MSTVSRKKGIHPRRIAVVAICAGLAIAAVVFWCFRESADQLLRKGRQAFSQRRYADAERYAVKALSVDPQSRIALLLAAKAASKAGRTNEAIGYYAQIPDDGSSDAVTARCRAGEILLRNLKRLSAAEEQFRKAAEQDADNVLAHDRLAYILGLATRNWELIPHQLAMLRLGDPNPRRLYVLSLGDRLPTDPTMIRDYGAESPTDPAVLLGLAQIDAAEQKHERAKQLLRQAVDLNPKLIEAHLKLGRLLAEHDSADAFASWHQSVPQAAEGYPGLWVIRGFYARRTGDREAAARCFWEAILRDPNHQQANYQLGRLLVSLQRSRDADPFLKRSHLLEKYVHAVFVNAWGTSPGSGDAREYLRVARLAETLDLNCEANAWRQLAEQQIAGGEISSSDLRRNSNRPQQQSSTRSTRETNPALKIDLSGFPLPDWSSVGVGPVAKAATRPPVSVTFEDMAAVSGIRFSYFNSNDPETEGSRIFESIGGGVAVLDYDADGWTDIYLTQGCRMPSAGNRHTHLDRLYRNLGNGRFEEVALIAGISENGYSQGVTAGDFNNDGFPDLYVANIGANRFYRNNGDGTFSDVTRQTTTGGSRWSSSCVLADLNGDARPDLYVVNYLSGSDVFERICQTPEGVSRTCPPNMFPAAQDQFYLNLGDGRFEKQTASAGIQMPDGKGLGVVAFDLDGSGQLSLFVANDQVANFLFVNQSARRGDRPNFVDEALLRGVALNRDGRAEACMGVAAGDADGDGLIDLFVTNFTEESNTLYLQQSGSMFQDATQFVGLGTPSLKTLGFGTQFVDGDLDGNLDLVVTNGHVDDRSDTGEQYKMRPQYFWNSGGGRFIELEPTSLGPFFGGEYLGRGMAKLDWNRDGLEDVAISHLDVPFSLLTNTTADHGHFVVVDLRGVISDRDAIGATVTATCGKKTLVRQLTAGDGFQASNQRHLVFGLGDHPGIDRLEVRWPSGLRQTFISLPADSELLFIEGHDRAILMKGSVAMPF